MEAFNLLIGFVNVNNQVQQRVRFRFLRDHSNPFEIPEKKFRKLFRLSRESAYLLVEELSEFNNERGRRNKIPFHLQVLISLNFYAQGCYQVSVGQDNNLAVSQPCVSRIIRKISRYFAENLLPRYVKFPTTAEEIALTKRGFQSDLNFPNTIGAIDCSHVAIIAPHINGVAYLNRKGYYSINVQVICDSKMKIINVNARFPGATHDAAIWESSTINGHLNNRFRAGERNTWLIGDAGYPLQPWLMTPVVDAPPNTPEANFSHRHSVARNVIERTFGSLKSRFRCLLKHRVLHYDHAAAGRIIYACAVLHNICRNFNLPEVEEGEINLNNYNEVEENQNLAGVNINNNLLEEGRLVRRRLIAFIN